MSQWNQILGIAYLIVLLVQCARLVVDVRRTRDERNNAPE